MGFLFVAVIAAIGFLFSRCHYPTRYRLSRSAGWTVYFEVVCWGLFILAAVTLVLALIDIANWARAPARWLGFKLAYLDELGISLFQFKMLIVTVAAFAVTAGLCLICRFYYTNERIEAIRVEQTSSDMLENIVTRVMIDSWEERGMEDPAYLMVTLKSRKVYVGIAELPPLEYGQPSYLTLTPVFSGYRGEFTHKVYFTNNYFDHYEQDPRFEENPNEVFQEYKINIAREEIEMVSLFRLGVYNQFREEHGHVSPLLG